MNEDVARVHLSLTLWRAGWVRSRSDTAPGVAACPLALELRDLLLPKHPGPDTKKRTRLGNQNKPHQTKLHSTRLKSQIDKNNCGWGKNNMLLC